jgi:hypothetical protein
MGRFFPGILGRFRGPVIRGWIKTGPGNRPIFSMDSVLWAAWAGWAARVRTYDLLGSKI